MSQTPQSTSRLNSFIPDELFPQATYYLDPSLKRPHYISNNNNNNDNDNNNISNGYTAPLSNMSVGKMEIESDSDDDEKEYLAGSKSTTDTNILIESSEKTSKLNISDNDINILKSSILNSNRNRNTNKFGTWDGVFASCLLNIFGVIMFLRLGFIVGQAGLWYTILIILLSGVVTTLTTLSMAAIASNGKLLEGGAYFMVSRSLGAHIGAGVGVLFSIGMSVAVALYVIGFCETFVNDVGTITDSIENDIRLYGFILLSILFLISIRGINWIIKIQLLLLFLLIIAIISFVIGCFMNYSNSKGSDVIGIKGWTNGNLVKNMTPHYTKKENIKYSFFVVFGIFFPAVTGIMAGANLSGDLKTPSYSIPMGTLSAIVVSTITYIVLAMLLAVVATQDKLIDDYFIMSIVSIWRPLILIGIYAATLSSALASLVGAPRILQKVSIDNLIPILTIFKKTNKKGEPIRAYIFTYIIALACVFTGDLNIIAPLITQFFLMTYSMISFACYFMSISFSPGWRPSFKYYNSYTALSGGIICSLIMLFIHIEYAVITIILGGIISFYVYYTKPSHINWGSAFESRQKFKANNAVLNLYSYKSHVKSWQPSFLTFIKNINNEINLIKFVSTLKHSFGTNIYCKILFGSFKNNISELLKHNNYLPHNIGIKSFYEKLVSSTSIRDGCRTLMINSGLGKLRPNTIILGFPESWHKEEDNNNNNLNDKLNNNDFVGLLVDSLKLNFGFMICRNLKSLPFGKIKNNNVIIDKSFNLNSNEFCSYIDIWWLLDDGGLSLLVPHVMSICKFYKQLTRNEEKNMIRLFLIADDNIINNTVSSDDINEKESSDNIFDKDQRKSSFMEMKELERISRQGLVAPSDIDKIKDSTELWKAELQALMIKFRLNITVNDVKSGRPTPSQETLEKFENLTNFKINDNKNDWIYNDPKLQRWLRVSEIKSSYSDQQKIIFITAPHPLFFKDSKIYLAVLDLLSNNNNQSTILIRGTGENCLTFYSE